MKNTFYFSLLLFFISVGIQAQDSYGFFAHSFYNNNSLDRKGNYDEYIMISDPVKNYRKMSGDQKEKFEEDFRNYANKEAGFEVMKFDSRPSPIGDYERFNSLAKARAAIEAYVKEQKEKRKDRKIKIIYVNLYEY